MGDPFPLFHLSDLSFTLDSLPHLSSAQLALASFSSEWDPDANLDKKVSRLFRQRREKLRTRLGTPIGIFASEAERAATQWPLFELSDLSWPLDGANLEQLTSAQLALIPFHPDSSKDLVEKAEDIFYTRRERDFAAGLSLPPLPPSPQAEQAPAPPPPPHCSRLPPPPDAASASSARGTTASKSNAKSWLDDAVEMAPPPPSAPALKESIWLVEYRRREEERKKRDDDDARAAAEKTENDVRRREDEVRRRQEDEARDTHRRKEDDAWRKAKRKEDAIKQQRDELQRREELKRQEDLKRKDDLKRHDYLKWQARAQDAKRKEDDERDARRRQEAARLAEDERVHNERERGYQLERQASSSSEKERLRERDRLEQDLGLMSHDRKRERAEDDEDQDRRRRRSSVAPRDEPDLDSPKPSRDGAWSRRSSRDCWAGSSTPTAPNRRIYTQVPDSESALPRDYDKPFFPEDDVPDELRNCFHVVFLGGIPASTNVEAIRSMLLDAYRLAPVAIKVSMVGPVGHVFLAFLDREDAKAVISRVNGQVLKGHVVQASFLTTPASASHASWRWFTCDREFQQEWRAGRIRLPVPRRDPLPTHYHSSVAPRAPPEDNSMVPRNVMGDLYQLFVSNLPETVTVDDLRQYFDHFYGIAGISICAPNRSFHNNSCYLAFLTREQRNGCMLQIDGKTFPRAKQTMYVETGEPKKLTQCVWRWLDMMKFFRIQHRHQFVPPSHSSPPAAPSLQLKSQKPSSPPRRRRSASPEPRRVSPRELDNSPELKRSSNSNRERERSPEPRRERSPELRRILSNGGSTSSALPPPPPSVAPGDDQGYTPSNPGVPGLAPLFPPLSPALSSVSTLAHPKVHPSRLQLFPEVPIVSNAPIAPAIPSQDVLKDALAALLPLTTPSKLQPAPMPPTTVERGSPASLGSNANWGARVRPSVASLNGGVPPSDTIGYANAPANVRYQRPSHISPLRSTPAPPPPAKPTLVDEDEDDFQPRDWTTWKPTPAPAVVAAPTPPKHTIARTGTTPTGPKRSLSIKGASGSPPLGATGVLSGIAKNAEAEGGGVKAHESFLTTLFSNARGAGKMINVGGEGTEGTGDGLGLGLGLGLAARIGGVDSSEMEVDADEPEGE